MKSSLTLFCLAVALVFSTSAVARSSSPFPDIQAVPADALLAHGGYRHHHGIRHHHRYRARHYRPYRFRAGYYRYSGGRYCR